MLLRTQVLVINTIDINMSATERKNPAVAVEAMEESRPTCPEAQPSSEDSWQTGFRRRFPWAGFIALCVVVICTVATIAVLKVSDGKAASDWW